MKPKISLPFVLLLFSSCIKEIDYHVDKAPAQLVVNSVIAAYHPVVVNISSLQSVFDDSLQFIPDATVVLSEEGGETDTLNYTTNGNYQSYIYGKPGKGYRLIVKANGYPTVAATDTVPQKVTINSATKKKSFTLDDTGTPHNDFTVSFTKQTAKTNYYELFFVNQSYHKLDSTYKINYESLTATIDPIILASGTTDFNGYTFLFNDSMVAIGEYTISMKMINGTTGWGSFKDPVITLRDNANAVVLRTVSRAYYTYRSSWLKHTYGRVTNPEFEDYFYFPLLGEPQDMYSNIENGLGIFVTYNQDLSFY
jgi:hypothetical protein